MADQEVILGKANFEKQTSAKIEARIKNNHLEALRHEKDVELYHRKKQLAELYNDEIARWREDIINSGETVADVKARCVSFASTFLDRTQ